MKMTLNDEWQWTPYDEKVDSAINKFKYMSDELRCGYTFDKVYDYICKLENIIESHGLQQEVHKAMKGG